MCDWGGGPNQAYNYIDDRPYVPPKPKAVYCQSNIKCDKPCYGKKRETHLHGCKTMIRGFTHSMIYTFYSDPVVHRHFKEVEHYRPLEEHSGSTLCTSDQCGHAVWGIEP